MQDPKITDKKFCEIIVQLLLNKDTKAIYEKTFSKESKCQLKK